MTTDLLAGTPLHRVELPANTVGFGLVEVLYLLSRHPGDRAATSREALLIPDDALDVQFALAGRSTLAARGLVAVTEDQTEQTRSHAALLEVAMGDTERWATVTVKWEGGADRVVVFEAQQVTAIVQPRALGTYFASFTDRPDAVAGLVLETIDLMLSQYAAAEFAVEVRSSPGAPPESLFVRRSATPDTWDLVRRRGGVDEASVVDGQGRNSAVHEVVASAPKGTHG